MVVSERRADDQRARAIRSRDVPERGVAVQSRGDERVLAHEFARSVEARLTLNLIEAVGEGSKGVVGSGARVRGVRAEGVDRSLAATSDDGEKSRQRCHGN